MLEKFKGNIKLCIDAIGISEIIRSYIFLGIFVFSMNSLFTGTSIFAGFGKSYFWICVLFYPFSIALYDLVVSFLFRNIVFFQSIFMAIIIWVFKTLILFAAAPLLGGVFILIVTFTNLTGQLVERYNNL